MDAHCVAVSLVLTASIHMVFYTFSLSDLGLHRIDGWWHLVVGSQGERGKEEIFVFESRQKDRLRK